MKKELLLIALSLASAIMFSGCATIFSGKQQAINLTSTPSGKMVTIAGRTVKTPSIITINRGQDNLKLTSTDCDNQKLVTKKINPVFFVNILSAGVFGSTTDYSSGAMWKYDENINLECQK